MAHRTSCKIWPAIMVGLLAGLMSAQQPATKLPATGDAIEFSDQPHFSIAGITDWTAAGGRGSDIFSTTFAQWATREGLRRAEPLTMLVRFTPRQRQKPMNELLTVTNAPSEFDATGSLVEADMAAY